MSTLHIISSPSWDHSQSNILAQRVISHLDTQTQTLDLHHSTIPYLTWASIAHSYGMIQDDQLTPDDRTINTIRTQYISQLKEIDTLIISVPMRNFGVPAALKSYIDLISQPWQTFMIEWGRYIWLLTNIKHAYICVATWWIGYHDGAMADYNHVSWYMTQTMWFLGAHETTVFYIEGTTSDSANYQTRLDASLAHIDAHFA